MVHLVIVNVAAVYLDTLTATALVWLYQDSRYITVQYTEQYLCKSDSVIGIFYENIGRERKP